MTNNPTIDGVSRGLIENTAQALKHSGAYGDLSVALFKLLDAPAVEPTNALREHCKQCAEVVKTWPEWKQNCLGGSPAVERKEPVKWWNGCNETVPKDLRYLANYERPSGGEQRFNAMHLIQLAEEIEDMAAKKLYEAAPEVAALQSTIAQLQERVAELESEEPEWSAMQQRLGDENVQLRNRVQELESELSDPVAWRGLNSLGDIVTEWIDGSPPEKLYDLCGNEAAYDKVELAYLASPSTVATDTYDEVLLPFLSLMRAELHANAHKGDRPGWLQMDRKTAVLEVFYHMGKLHQAVHRDEAAAIKEYAADVANMCMMLLDVCACLDATAALNGERK